MTPPTYPYSEIVSTVPFTDPENSVQGYTVVTDVITGPYTPPPPARRVLLGGNGPLQIAVNGGMGIVRRYAAQTGDAGAWAAQVAQDAKAGAKSLLSIGPGDPTKPYDSKAMESFRPVVENPDVLVIPWHEPDNTAPDVKTWRAFYEALATQFPKAVLVPTLMGITYFNGKASNWLVGLSRAAFYGADPYIHFGQTVAGQFDPARRYAESAGKQLIIAETGALSTTNQAMMLGDMGAYCQQYPSVYALAYWSAVGKSPFDWTLGTSGLAAFKTLLKSPPFAAD